MALPFKIGDKLPDVRLGSMGGNSVALRDHIGKKVLVFVWSSWCGCRDLLGGLQKFHEKHPDLPVVSIACDVQGQAYPMRYLRAAGATFEMWMDAVGNLTRRWNLKITSVAVLLDEQGCVMASAIHPDDAFYAGVERLLSRPAPDKEVPEPKVDTKNTQVEILMQSCNNILTRNRKKEAADELRKALEIDPENVVVKKQIWAIEHPEKFYEGAIDKEWQKQQK